MPNNCDAVSAVSAADAAVIKLVMVKTLAMMVMTVIGMGKKLVRAGSS